MTTLTAPADLPLPSRRRSKLAWAAADCLVVAKRNIIGMTRRPQLLAFVTIQPVLVVLVVRFVFGGSVQVPGGSYPNLLLAGIFVATVLFGAPNTAIGMAEDLHNGLLERFRSLVMARSAVLAGRVLADAVRNLFVVVLMLGVGYLVGFRLHTNPAALMAPTGVLLLFAFAISWVTAPLGLAAKSAEAAGAAALHSPSCSPFPPAPSC